MTAQSEKVRRYDRQLRLWGDHGQKALESAHICLVNASAVGAETLKNLVLPGIGAFTVIDCEQVGQEDLGSNFFVSEDALGAPRAKIVVELLLELNSEVRGNFITDSVDSLLTSNPDFFSQFTTVIATELPEVSLLKLAKVLWKASIPLLVSQTCGLLGYIRIATQTHEIVESHPDNYHEDLRLDCPFPELVRYINKFDLDAMNNTEHGDVPYLVVLYKYLQKWRESHGGEMPKNYREKKSFKELIRGGIRTNEDGVPLDEDNFAEAIQNVNSLIIPTEIPSAVQSILEDPASLYITPESSNFWLLVRSVREFVTAEGNGRLPLRGAIPDMTASSDKYIELQRVYQVKAREDMEAVAGHLSQLLATIGKPTNSILEDEIRQFCRNSAFLRVVRYRSLEEEYQTPRQDELTMNLENQDSLLIYYVLLRASEQFYSMYRSYPGERDSGVESDVAQLKTIVSSLLQKWGIATSSISDDYITEFCRYGAGKVHTVAAFVGGVASQEVIKLETRQFVPLNNTLIYSAATCSTVTATL